MTPGSKSVILGIGVSTLLTIVIGGGTWMIKEQIDTGKHLVRIDVVLSNIAQIMDDTKTTVPPAVERRFATQDGRMNLLEFRVSKMEDKFKK